jgi:protein ImuB
MPHWPTDLILRRRQAVRSSADRPDRPPVLLYVETAGRQLVTRCCEQAAAAGVRAGLTVAHARALLTSDDAVIMPQQPERDQAALKTLARWALRFSPIVATDPPDGLSLDVAGCERLFGGERRLLDLIADAVEGLGFRTRVAMAPTFACAWAVTRFGAAGRTIVCEGNHRRVLADLSVAALRLEQNVVKALGEVGIERIGHLLALPRSSLPARFGHELLRRLDEAVGRAPETIDPVRPVSPVLVERVFSGPVKQPEAIDLTVRELVAELSGVLERRECGARRIELRVDRFDAGPLLETLTLSRPSRDARHLWSLLRPRVESINLGWGVERLCLAAPHLGRLPHEDQTWAWAGESTDHRKLDQSFGELLDTLGNRLGQERVVRAEPVASHLPERWGQKERGQTLLPAAGKGVCPPFSADRPSLLLERPEPVEVIAMTPDGPPSWFRWRGLDQCVTVSAGPERLAMEWWRGSSPATRDYFKIQDEHGRWLWIYRTLESGRWFVHGLWA